MKYFGDFYSAPYIEDRAWKGEKEIVSRGEPAYLYPYEPMTTGSRYTLYIERTQKGAFSEIRTTFGSIIPFLGSL